MIELYLMPVAIPSNLDRHRPIVVIDIFRASTSITAALAAGAAEIWIAGSLEEAASIKARLGPKAVLAGERGGFKIGGYDLGNSPREMISAAVAGRPVIFNSTNGTRLLRRFDPFPYVAVGSLVSLKATVSFITGFSDDPVLCCAGQEGFFSAEDTLAAGLIISRLGRGKAEMDDAAAFACRLVELAGDQWRQWARDSEHGRCLTSIGMGDDLDLCLETDRYDFVPMMTDGRLIHQSSLEK